MTSSASLKPSLPEEKIAKAAKDYAARYLKGKEARKFLETIKDMLRLDYFK